MKTLPTNATCATARDARQPDLCPVCDRQAHPDSTILLCPEHLRTATRDGLAVIERERQGAVDRLRAEGQADRAQVEPGVARDGVLGLVYFIKRGSLVKIGWSRNVEQRRRAVGGEILATLPGYMRDERAMHDRFAMLRMHGEWFAYTPALATYIEQIAAEAA